MKYLTLIIILCASFFANAQDTLLIHFDSLWKEVPKEKASFYRKMVKNDNDTWSVNDFYLNGQIQMIGTYKSKKAKKRQGHFIYYYENGQKMSEGNYTNNKKEGEWNYWYKNGQKESKGNYTNNKKEGEWNYWYKTGKIDMKGNYVNNKYDKEWQFYFESGQISAKENYNKGKLVDFEFWDEDGSKVEGNLKTFIKAEFIGGENALNSYLSKELKYPESARINDFSGVVYIRFIIDADGTITNAEVIKSVSKLIDREALRVIKKMPKWTPGKLHNRPVRVSFVIPIRFVLN